MYLPLAAIVTLFMVGGYRLIQMISRQTSDASDSLRHSRLPNAIPAVTALILACVLSMISAKRVAAYNDPIALWREVIQHQPNNFVAHDNLGSLLLNAKRQGDESSRPIGTSADANAEAIEYLRRAIELSPDVAATHNNLGIALANGGHTAESAKEFQRAVELKPDFAKAHSNLGIALFQLGQQLQGIEHLELGVKLNPNMASAYSNLAQGLAMMHRPDDAIATAKKGLEIARSTNQQAMFNQIENWLLRYQNEQKQNPEGRSTSPD